MQWLTLRSVNFLSLSEVVEYDTETVRNFIKTDGETFTFWAKEKHDCRKSISSKWWKFEKESRKYMRIRLDTKRKSCLFPEFFPFDTKYFVYRQFSNGIDFNCISSVNIYWYRYLKNKLSKRNVFTAFLNDSFQNLNLPESTKTRL